MIDRLNSLQNSLPKLPHEWQGRPELGIMRLATVGGVTLFASALCRQHGHRDSERKDCRRL